MTLALALKALKTATDRVNKLAPLVRARRKNNIKPSHKPMAKRKVAATKNPVKKTSAEDYMRYAVEVSHDAGITWKTVVPSQTKVSAEKIAHILHSGNKMLWVRTRPSTSKPHKNPASSDELRCATNLSRAFVGRDPDDHEFKTVPMPKLPKAMTAIGKIAAIEYIAERDGKVYTFRHEFKVKSRPHLAVSPDGKIATMIGGSWLFTEDGFEDR